MISTLALVIGALLLAVIAPFQAQLEREEDPRAGSLTLLRTLVLMLTAIVSLAALDEFATPTLLVALALVTIWLAQQRIGRILGKSNLNFARFDGLVTGWAKAVAGLRLTDPVIAEEFEQELYESVEEFADTVVREVMVPRVDLVVLDSDETLEGALSQFIASGHSRIPVIGKSIDDIVGMLYLKDVARIAHQDPARLASTRATEITRDPLFTPESKPVADLLREMQLSSTQIAIVVDEYGGVAGLATMEDLIEELIGDISDEYDREPAEIVKLSDGLFRVSPRLTIAELAEELAIELDDEDVETVGGLFTKLLGMLPSGGETVSIASLELTAERVEPKRQRIISVLVRKLG
jgi:CBS domain containing-hemolysin-like protein